MDYLYCIVGCVKMNNRFFNNAETNTITLYNQKTDGTYQRSILSNVYLRKVRKSIINSKGEQVASSATVIIPTAYATINGKLAINSFIDCKSADKQNAMLNFTLNAPLIENPWTLIDGDYIVDKANNMDFDLRKLKKDFRVFRIQSVADNRKGNLKHFKLEVLE